MSNFLRQYEDARFCFTQELNDDRWAVILKYILLPLFNSRDVKGIVRQIRNSEGEFSDFGVIFSSDKMQNELVDAFTNYAYYGHLITFNNSYQKKFLNKYKSLNNPLIKRIYDKMYKIDTRAPSVSINVDEILLYIANMVNIVGDDFESDTKNIDNSGLVLSARDRYKSVIDHLGKEMKKVHEQINENSFDDDDDDDEYYGGYMMRGGVNLNNQNEAEKFYKRYVMPKNIPIFTKHKPNTYWTNKLRDMAKVPGHSDETGDEEDAIIGLNIEFNKWYRKNVGGNYRYFYITQDASGTDKSIENNDYVPEGKTCGGLELRRDDCNKIMSILASRDPDYIKNQLKTLLEDKDFWQDIKKSIEQSTLHPHIAIEILKRFGFKKVEGEPRICSVTHWLEKIVAKKFLDAAMSIAEKDKFLKTVRSNEKLNKFLTYLVHYINNNPGLLDQNYTVTNDVYHQYNTDDEIPQWIREMGIEARLEYRNATDDKSLESLVRTAGLNYGRNTYTNIREMRDNIIRYLTQILPQYNQAMYGGNPIIGIKLPYVDISREFNNENCHKFYSDMFKRLLAQAERRNMKITTKDHNYIEAQLKNLRIYQQKLHQILTKFAKIVIENNNRNDKTQMIDINAYITKLDERLDKTYAQQEKIRNSMYKILNSSAFARELNKLTSKQRYESIDAAFE
ncbi:hypothetical protein Hokovirus_2_153 [Hokovirus HKV1]|uniref:Uncharacterized protein n=1 Tax=Hokovirus HKV1 TaxID=1977638 RepID=A0A1V0SFX0_9VIRU|nr:hypothetical protein Hokovirus_2_153 [Hokovirus HKV1]